MVSTLLYADDIILIAPTAEKLSNWCQKWRLTVNPEKSKVIHFRTSTVPQSTFKCGEKEIEYLSSYKYLGLWSNEHLDMTKTVKELAKSARRALSALYSKSLRAGGMTLNVLKKSFTNHWLSPSSSTAVACGEYQTSRKFKWYKTSRPRAPIAHLRVNKYSHWTK